MRVISATILIVYCKLLVPPLCFCINCGRGWRLTSHTPPPPSPFPLHHCRSPYQLVVWGVVSPPPDPNPTPPPQTLVVSGEVCGWEMRTVWGEGRGGVRGQAPPTVLISHPQTSQLTTSVCGGGRIGVRGMGYHAPTPQAGRVRAGGKGGTIPQCYLDLQRSNKYSGFDL
jgi:hypothetical protein